MLIVLLTILTFNTLKNYLGTQTDRGQKLTDLKKKCPGESATHKHAKWGQSAGQFAMALETVYPEKLCEEMADNVVEKVGGSPGPALAVLRARGVHCPQGQSSCAASLHRPVCAHSLLHRVQVAPPARGLPR